MMWGGWMRVVRRPILKVETVCKWCWQFDWSWLSMGIGWKGRRILESHLNGDWKLQSRVVICEGDQCENEGGVSKITPNSVHTVGVTAHQQWFGVIFPPFYATQRVWFEIGGHSTPIINKLVILIFNEQTPPSSMSAFQSSWSRLWPLINLARDAMWNI